METLKWYIKDESIERPGYLCLAIREVESDRLICDLADHPLECTGIVERTKEEANLIAHAKELRDMLERTIYAYETKNEPKYADSKLFRETRKAAYALLDKLKGVTQ